MRNAAPGSIVWNYATDGSLRSVTIDTSRPLYVTSHTGDDTKVTALSDEYTYLGTLADKSLTLPSMDIGHIDKDMILIAGKGVNFNQTGSTAIDQKYISARNLTIYAGAGDIGSQNDVLLTKITGTLQANSGGSIYIDNSAADSDLALSSIAAGDTLDLDNGARNIEMEKAEDGDDSSKNETNIYAGNKVNLHVTGKNGVGSSIGSSTASIRVKTGTGVVNAAAEGASVVIEGIGGGSLILGDIETGSLSVTADEGTVKLSRDADKDSDGNVIRPAETADIEASHVTIDARDIDLTDGTVKVRDSGSGAASDGLTFSARNSITQKDTENSVIASNKGNLITFRTGSTGTPGGDIVIKSSKNSFDTVGIQAYDEKAGLSGSIDIKTNAPGRLDAIFGAGEDGSGTLYLDGNTPIQIENLDQTAEIGIGGKLTTVKAPLDFKTSNALTVMNDAILTSVSSLRLDGASLTVEDGARLKATGSDGIRLVAEECDAVISGTFDAEHTDIISANKDVILNNGTAIKGDLMANATDIHVNGAIGDGVSVGTAATLNALKNVIVDGGITSERGDIEITTKLEDVTVGGNIKSLGGNAVIHAGRGALVSGNITSRDGKAIIEAGNSVRISGKLGAKEASVTTGTGDVTLAEGAGAIGALTVQSGGALTVDSTGSNAVIVGGDAVLSSSQGGTHINGNISSKSGDISLTSDGGNVEVDGSITAQKGRTDIHALAADGDETNSGFITVKGHIEAKEVQIVTGDENRKGNDIALEDINVTGPVTVMSGRDLSVKNITTNGNADLGAMRNVITNGAIENKTGMLNIVTVEGSAVLSGKITSSNALITSGDRIELKDDVTAVGNLSAIADSGIDISHDITSKQGQLMLAATTGDINIDGSAKAEDNLLDIKAERGNVNIHGNAEATDIHIAALGQAASEGHVTADGTVTAENVLDIRADRDILIGRGVSAGNKIKLLAGNDIMAAAAHTRNFEADAGGDIHAEDINAAGMVVLDAKGRLDLGKDIAAQESISLTSGEDIKLNSVKSTNGGNISVTSAGTIDIADIGSTDTNSVMLDGRIIKAGKVTSDDGIKMNGGSIETDTIKTSGNVNLIGKNETRAETIDAGGAVTATSGTVVMKTVTTKGLADISGDSISVGAIDAEQAKLTGGTVGVGIVTTKSQADISGKTIIVSTLKAGNAAHVYGGAVDLDTVTAGGDIGILGDNRINIGSIDAKHDAMITQIGIGNTIIDSGSVGNDILISQLSIGNLDVSNLHAKDIARFTVENGDMTLKNISTDKRIGIFNFSRDGITTMDNVHAPNLISYLAFHPHMNDVTSHVVFDILTAGDPARRAIGWKTAAFVKSKVLFGLEIYRYNHRTYDIGGFIDYAPSLYSPENAEAADILIAED